MGAVVLIRMAAERNVGVVEMAIAKTRTSMGGFGGATRKGRDAE